MAFLLTSPAFSHGKPIPASYTGEGKNISPPLQWTDPHESAQSFALICDDPDAPGGNWVHWVIYGIPGEARSLDEATPADAQLPGGARNGVNSWNRLGYGGPMPPSGTHRYFFKLYALDTALGLKPGASKEQLLKAMQGHVIAMTELMGTYMRKP